MRPNPSEQDAIEAFVKTLLEQKWESTAGPLRLSQNLTNDDVKKAALFQDVRVLLRALAQVKSVPTTANGNLTRAFIATIYDQLSLSDHDRKSIAAVCKVLNETDVWPLHLAFVIAQCAGLVVKRGKTIQLTKSGKTLIADDQVGALYRQVFIANFKRYNLGHGFPWRDAPALQATVPVTLWRLNAVVASWRAVKGIAPQILIPPVVKQLHEAMTNPYDTEEWILIGYILLPLFRLGLLEVKEESEHSITQDDTIRISPLWRKFITFDNILEPKSGRSFLLN